MFSQLLVRFFNLVTVFAFCLCSASLLAQEKPKGDAWYTGVDVEFDETKGQVQKDTQAESDIAKISREVQALKKEVIVLNKDLRLLEENMLFPSNTRFTVFITVNSGRFFTLESVKVKIDGRLVTSHVYSEKQRTALLNGGVQKLYVTNMSEGEHRLTAFFTGIGANDRVYKRAAELEFDKGLGSQYLEILVTDDESTQEPVFKLKQW